MMWDVLWCKIRWDIFYIYWCIHERWKWYNTINLTVTPLLVTNKNNLHNKRRYVSLFVCLFVCLSWSMFRIAGQTSGPIETKLDTRTHVHPGSVSGKVSVKVIHVCLREWQKYETPAKRHLANDAHTTSGRLAQATPSERLRNAVQLTRRASAAGGSRTPSGGRVLTASKK